MTEGNRWKASRSNYRWGNEGSVNYRCDGSVDHNRCRWRVSVDNPRRLSHDHWRWRRRRIVEGRLVVQDEGHNDRLYAQLLEGKKWRETVMM